MKGSKKPLLAPGMALPSHSMSKAKLNIIPLFGVVILQLKDCHPRTLYQEMKNPIEDIADQETARNNESGVDCPAASCLWRDYALAAEEKMSFMVMPRDYWDDDWTADQTKLWNQVRERYYNAKRAAENDQKS